MEEGHGPFLGLLCAVALLACAACSAPSAFQAPPDLKAQAREALARLDQGMAVAPLCGTGWAETSAGYVVAVAAWTEHAGLRLGDQIVAVAGTPMTAVEERVRAYRRLGPGEPFALGVLRKGQSLTLSIPCRYQPDLFRTERRTLEAASRGDWDGCIAAAREARMLAGLTTAYVSLVREHACMKAREARPGSPEAREFAALHADVAKTLVRESRYVPGGNQNVREVVLPMIEELRRSGYAGYADDVEALLAAQLAAFPKLTLTWADNSTDEEGFVIERRIGRTGPFQPLVTLPPNTRTYVDTAVQEDTTYCYRVKAFTALRHSEPSNVACAVPAPRPSPSDRQHRASTP